SAARLCTGRMCLCFSKGETAVTALRSYAAASVAAFVWTVTINAQAPVGALTLEQVLATALRQHPQVEAAAARVDAARGMLRTARTPPNPMLSYMTEGNRFPGQGSNALFLPEQSFFASVPFDPFVRRQPRIARADAD